MGQRPMQSEGPQRRQTDRQKDRDKSASRNLHADARRRATVYLGSLYSLYRQEGRSTGKLVESARLFRLLCCMCFEARGTEEGKNVTVDASIGRASGAREQNPFPCLHASPPSLSPSLSIGPGIEADADKQTERERVCMLLVSCPSDPPT
mmetsp:Transcript_31365/g.61940  ORF Transcript_31365/g.61940 Transcript_31365/m.61940 type:complete len:150 (-) Transcript_31365:272-721(-)